MLMYVQDEQPLPDFLDDFASVLNLPLNQQEYHLTSATHALRMAAKIIKNDPSAPAYALTREDEHPLETVFAQAIHQVTGGKGVRHGGDSTPFMDQPWLKLANTYGPGFLYGQSAKKAGEAMGKTGEQRKRELLGAMVYLAMGILFEEQKNG
jgi:hypothetical protein